MSGYPPPGAVVTAINAYLFIYCLHRWVVAANMSALEKGQHDTKANDGTGKTATDLSARVTICFKGVRLCDSQSIKQYTQHIRHRRSHPLPHVLEDTNTIHDWLYQLFSAHKWASEPRLVGCTGNEPENGEIMFSVLFISVGLCTKSTQPGLYEVTTWMSQGKFVPPTS